MNNRIKVRDQVRSPTAGELKALRREMHELTGGRRQLIVLGDVSKAHRRIKVRREEGGWQACRLEEGRIWMSCVGTYGIASAGLWLGRLAAAVVVSLFY